MSYSAEIPRKDSTEDRDFVSRFLSGNTQVELPQDHQSLLPKEINDKLAPTGGKMALPFGVFNLITTVMGAGLLSLPYAFSIGGLVPASIALILILIISLFSGHLLIDTLSLLPQSLKVFNFEDLSVFSYGIIAKVLSLLTIIVLLYPSHIAYMILTRDQLELITEFSFNHLNATNSTAHYWITQKYTLMSLAYIPLLPICFLPKIRFLGYTSFFGFSCLLIVSISFIVFSVIGLVHDADATVINFSCANFTSPGSICVPLFPSSIFKFLESLTIIALVFVCHFNILPICHELYRSTKLRRKLTVTSTLSIVFCVYILVGIFTTLQFGSNVQSDVMKSYDADSIVLLVERCLLFLALLPHYPILLFPFRASVIYLIGLICDLVVHLKLVVKDDLSLTVRESRFVWFFVTLCSFILAFAPACFVPNVDIVWGFVGSFGSVLVVFIWPALFYLKVRRDYWRKTTDAKCNLGIKGALSIAMIIIGIVIMFMCTTNHILVIAGVED
ncbi:Sodium-coupled neutral amino acid transporter 6 [Oopsacas minuta]|uniref:Sodium-coupled neutral amino acid transporter 6 n=1 Tax=Oopsacas minuta TaxID=111878 RepID=A0AAV7KD01_9METZ|nr:Sodium-coupled neutral amino acid transporter 6 [Oopsacas minuta]